MWFGKDKTFQAPMAMFDIVLRMAISVSLSLKNAWPSHTVFKGQPTMNTNTLAYCPFQLNSQAKYSLVRNTFLWLCFFGGHKTLTSQVVGYLGWQAGW